MAKFELAEWLSAWLLDTARFEFEWDDGNRVKSAKKHGVTAAEAEEVFTNGRMAPLGVQVIPSVPEERFGVVGTTSEGRVLHVVFTLRGCKVRVISARAARGRELEYHEAHLREV